MNGYELAGRLLYVSKAAEAAIKHLELHSDEELLKPLDVKVEDAVNQICHLIENT